MTIRPPVESGRHLLRQLAAMTTAASPWEATGALGPVALRRGLSTGLPFRATQRRCANHVVIGRKPPNRTAFSYDGAKTKGAPSTCQQPVHEIFFFLKCATASSLRRWIASRQAPTSARKMPGIYGLRRADSPRSGARSERRTRAGVRLLHTPHRKFSTSARASPCRGFFFGRRRDLRLAGGVAIAGVAVAVAARPPVAVPVAHSARMRPPGTLAPPADGRSGPALQTRRFSGAAEAGT